MLHYKITFLALIVALSGMGSALHYKNRLERLSHPNLNAYDKTMIQAKNIARLATNIRIATYPTECDKRTKAVIGESCDLGNYMEWAGPELERESQALLELIQQK